jgi:hypothetical protein
MPYTLLAGLVLITHLAFMLFAVFGGLLALRWRMMPWLHLPAVAWGTFVETSGRVCPLTPLENLLRRAGGEAGYEGGFLDHYLVALLYPDNLTRATQVVLAAALVLFNLVVYAVVWRRSILREVARRRRAG